MKDADSVIIDLTALREKLEECFFEIDNIVARLKEAEWMERKVIFREDADLERSRDDF